MIAITEPEPMTFCHHFWRAFMNLKFYGIGNLLVFLVRFNIMCPGGTKKTTKTKHFTNIH